MVQSISDNLVSCQPERLAVCNASPRGVQLNVVGTFTVRTEIGGAASTDQASAWLENRYLRAGEVQRSAQRPGVGPGTDRALAKTETPIRVPNARLDSTRAACGLPRNSRLNRSVSLIHQL